MVFSAVATKSAIIADEISCSSGVLCGRLKITGRFLYLSFTY
jgi:hypothetical protein